MQIISSAFFLTAGDEKTQRKIPWIIKSIFGFLGFLIITHLQTGIF
jgi:hypothetical protein